MAKSQEVAIAGPRLPYPAGLDKRFPEVDRAGWKALVEAVFPLAKEPGSVVMAMAYCSARGLDIFKHPVHIVPVWDNNQRKMVEGLWPGISELRTTAFRTGEYAGHDDTSIGKTVTEEFTGKNETKVTVSFPSWMQITVYRLVQGQRHAFPGPRVYWKEAYASTKTGAPNSMWQKRPFGQLEKVAEAAALRSAFPEEIGGELTAEEMQGQAVDITPPTEPDTPRPTKAKEPEPVDAEIVEEEGAKTGDPIGKNAPAAENPPLEGDLIFELFTDFGEEIFSTDDPAIYVANYIEYFNKCDDKIMFADNNADYLVELTNDQRIEIAEATAEKPEAQIDMNPEYPDEPETVGELLTDDDGDAEERAAIQGQPSDVPKPDLTGEHYIEMGITASNKPDLTNWYVQCCKALDKLTKEQGQDWWKANSESIALLKTGRKNTYEALVKKCQELPDAR